MLRQPFRLLESFKVVRGAEVHAKRLVGRDYDIFSLDLGGFLWRLEHQRLRQSQTTHLELVFSVVNVHIKEAIGFRLDLVLPL